MARLPLPLVALPAEATVLALELGLGSDTKGYFSTKWTMNAS
jgi:hypothetical protein